MEAILEESAALSTPQPARAPVAPPRHAPSPGGIRPEVLARVQQFIDAHCHEPLHVEDLAREASLSPFHFARMFKLSVGHAPHAYVTMKRMERACALLSGTEQPIVEVARQVGFRTQAHFSGVFRKQVGVTPGQYRRGRRPAA